MSIINLMWGILRYFIPLSGTKSVIFPSFTSYQNTTTSISLPQGWTLFFTSSPVPGTLVVVSTAVPTPQYSSPTCKYSVLQRTFLISLSARASMLQNNLPGTFNFKPARPFALNINCHYVWTCHKQGGLLLWYYMWKAWISCTHMLAELTKATWRHLCCNQMF